MPTYQGPVRPSDNSQTFRDTGSSTGGSSNRTNNTSNTTPQFQGPVRPTDNSQTFRDTGHSSGGSSNRNRNNNPQTIPQDSVVNQAIKNDFGNSATAQQMRNVMLPKVLTDVNKNVQSVLEQSRQQKLIEQQQRNARIQEETERLKGYRIVDTPFTKSGRGTIMQSSEKPYTNEQLIQRGATGQSSRQAVMNVLQSREQEKLDTKYAQVISQASNSLNYQGQQVYNQEYENAKSRIANYSVNIDLQVSEGKISIGARNNFIQNKVDEENKRLESLGKDIQATQQQKLYDFSNQYLQRQGKADNQASQEYLAKASDKIQLGKFVQWPPLIVAGGALAGAGAGAIAGSSALASNAVRIGSQVLLGASVGAESYNLGSRAIQGTLNGYTIANAVLPFVAFGVGAKIGSKFSNINPTELKNAIGRSDVETNIVQSVTNEQHIARLNIPEYEKPNLLSYQQKGYSIREVKADIVARNEFDRVLIDKGLPERNIRFVEVVNQNGQVINRIAVGKVEVTKGSLEFKQNILSKGSGTYNPQTQETKIENINFLANKEGDVVGLSKTAEIIKAQSQNTKIAIMNADGSISFKPGRITDITSRTFEAKSIEGNKLTNKQLSEVLDSDYIKLTRTSKGNEVQTLEKINKKTLDLSNNERLLGVEKIFKTQQGKSISEKFIQPIEFTKTKVNSKGFEDFSYLNKKLDKEIEELTNLAVIKTGQTPVQINERVNAMLKPVDLSSDILKSLQKSADTFNIKTSSPKMIGVDKKFQNELDKATSNNKITFDTNILNVNKGKNDLFGSNTMPKLIDSINQPSKQLDVQAIAQPQITIEKLNQAIKQMPKYDLTNIRLPKINLPDVYPVGFGSSSSSGGGGKSKKKLKTKTFDVPTGYTSSLANAFLQDVPLKVSLKEFERLNKKTYSGLELRPVLEIVPDKVLNNVTSKKQIKRFNKALSKAKKNSGLDIGIDWSI